MAKRRSWLRRLSSFLAVAVMIVVAAAVGYWLVGRSGPPPAQTPPPKPTPSPAARERRKVNIYILKLVNDEARLVPEQRTIPEDQEPYRATIERLIATNHETGPSQYLIPIGTKLLGLEVRRGIAYVSFSRELKDNFTGGSTNEALLVNAIIHTLTQFKDVDKVQILIEGKKVDTLGGHLDISRPAAGDSTLLGEGDAQ